MLKSGTCDVNMACLVLGVFLILRRRHQRQFWFYPFPCTFEDLQMKYEKTATNCMKRIVRTAIRSDLQIRMNYVPVDELGSQTVRWRKWEKCRFLWKPCSRSRHSSEAKVSGFAWSRVKTNPWLIGIKVKIKNHENSRIKKTRKRLKCLTSMTGSRLFCVETIEK